MSSFALFWNWGGGQNEESASSLLLFLFRSKWQESDVAHGMKKLDLSILTISILELNTLFITSSWFLMSTLGWHTSLTSSCHGSCQIEQELLWNHFRVTHSIETSVIQWWLLLLSIWRVFFLCLWTLGWIQEWRRGSSEISFTHIYR